MKFLFQNADHKKREKQKKSSVGLFCNLTVSNFTSVRLVLGKCVIIFVI